MLVYMSSQILEKTHCHVLEKRINFFEEYYKILSKKILIISKSNICFNLIFLIKELNLKFANV